MEVVEKAWAHELIKVLMITFFLNLSQLCITPTVSLATVCMCTRADVWHTLLLSLPFNRCVPTNTQLPVCGCFSLQGQTCSDHFCGGALLVLAVT